MQRISKTFRGAPTLLHALLRVQSRHRHLYNKMIITSKNILSRNKMRPRRTRWHETKSACTFVDPRPMQASMLEPPPCSRFRRQARSLLRAISCPPKRFCDHTVSLRVQLYLGSVPVAHHHFAGSHRPTQRLVPVASVAGNQKVPKKTGSSRAMYEWVGGALPSFKSELSELTFSYSTPTQRTQRGVVSGGSWSRHGRVARGPADRVREQVSGRGYGGSIQSGGGRARVRGCVLGALRAEAGERRGEVW